MAVQTKTKGRTSSPATTIARRLTPSGMELLPDELRASVEAALEGGGREAWVFAPDDGRVWVEVRNAKR